MIQSSFPRMLMMSCLMSVASPALAASEQDIGGWLNKVVPVALTNDPAQPGMLDSKKPFFTPDGFNGFSKTLERMGALQVARQVVAVCIADMRMQEGGTWIVDTNVVFKAPKPPMQAIEEQADKAAAPKPKASPYTYEKAQFYIKDVATAADVRINQYIPEAAPKEGFANCRAPGEVEERTGAIDEQLKFYESTLATLNERIADLHAQKAAIMNGAPMPAAAAPAPVPAQAPMAVQQPVAGQMQQPTVPQPAQPASQQIMRTAPMPLQPGMQIQQAQPMAATAPIAPATAPTQPVAQTAAQPSIDRQAAEHILRAPAGAVPVMPVAPVAPQAPMQQQPAFAPPQGAVQTAQ